MKKSLFRFFKDLQFDANPSSGKALTLKSIQLRKKWDFNIARVLRIFPYFHQSNVEFSCTKCIQVRTHHDYGTVQCETFCEIKKLYLYSCGTFLWYKTIVMDIFLWYMCLVKVVRQAEKISFKKKWIFHRFNLWFHWKKKLHFWLRRNLV